MNANELVLFLDTNSLLHYPPIKEVAWRAVGGCPSVRLVLCMQVIHELDEKKADARLSDRAGRVIKEVRAIRSAGGAVRDGVSLEVFNYEVRAADLSNNLSYDSKDDRIVQSVKKYAEAHPGARVAVYTEDMGMGLRCEAHGIGVVEPAAQTRLENPQDELTRKYRQAVSDLSALKNRLPAFAVRVVPAGTADLRAKNEYELHDSWQAVDPQTEVEKARQANPKTAPPPTLGRSGFGAFLSRASEEDYQRYNDELDAYYRDCGQFYERLNAWGRAMLRTITFDLWLHNSGSSPAEDVDFLLKLPTRLAWVALGGTDDAKLFDRPDPPQPPRPPGPLRFDSSAFHSLMSPRPLLSATAQIDRVLAERDQDKLQVRPLGGDGFLIHAKLKRLKHGHNHHVGTFHGLFRDWSEVGSFQGEYSISTSELPDSVRGKLPFLVRINSDIEG